jgi:hypothetical protein
VDSTRRDAFYSLGRLGFNLAPLRIRPAAAARIRHKTPAKRPRRRLDSTWHRRFDLPQPWIQPGAFYSLGFNLGRCGFDQQPEIVSNHLIRHKTPAKMIKPLHKITAKMAKTLGLDQHDENQSKNT